MVFLARSQHRHGSQRLVVDGIGEELCLKRQTFAEIQGLATLANTLAIEEIAAIELQAHLVAPHLHFTTALRFRQRGVPRVGLDVSFIDNPVVVVALGIPELFIISSDIIANAMFLTEVKRGLFYARELTVGNQMLIDGGHITRIDLQLMVKDGTIAFTLQVKKE